MNRKTLFCLSIMLIPAFQCTYAQTIPYHPSVPSSKQIVWQEMEQTMFVHFDPATWQNSSYDNHSTPLSRINPDKLDVDQWIDVAESWGAKMIIYVAKHAGGFCWWQTETTPYSIKNTTYRNGKGDVLAELAEACEKRGMKLGIYISPSDLSFGAYPGGGGRTSDSTKQEEYNHILRTQWQEVLSRTPHISEIWFDGSVIVPLEDIIKKYAPDAIVFQGSFADIRWVGNERGFAPYPAWNSIKLSDAQSGNATAAHGDPDGEVWMPAEVDVPLKNHDWFWSPDNYKKLRSLDELIDIYYNSVGHGCQLLLNSAPDTSGLIPQEDVSLYKLFGSEIKRRFGQSICETSGKGDTVELVFEKSTLVDHLIIQEDIAFGERVRRYVIEGKTDGEWFRISAGISVGYKHIQQFSPVSVDKLRFRCTESKLPPVIKRLAAYYVNDSKDHSAIASDRDDYGTPWVKGEQRTNNEQNAGKLESFNNVNGIFEADISSFIPLPGQYEIEVRNTKTNKNIPPVNPSLLLYAKETPGLLTPTENGVLSMSISAYPTMEKHSIMLRFELPEKAKPGDLELFIREIKF
ncbi:MAG: alpha-L-fucosidase [Bacteroidota bacterium]